MTLIIKLSRCDVWFDFTWYIFQCLFMVWGVLFFTLIYPPWPDDYIELLFPICLCTYGTFGIHHLLKFAFGKRRRTELHFDGATLSVQIAGRELAQFTASDVRAYFPYRNAIELTDGRGILLPSSMPHTAQNEIGSALPWVNAWWPTLDLPAAIRDAERETGWIRHLPNASITLGLLGFLLCYILAEGSLGFLIAGLGVGIPFTCFFPDQLKNYWRRKVVIHLPAIDDGELEPQPSVDHDESFAHDRA